MTPIAFNLTPRLKACLPGDTRYSTLLALYEALQEAAVFEMAQPAPASNEPVPDAEGWIEWNGGEQPIPNGTSVEVKFRDTDWPVATDMTADCYAWKWSASRMGSWGGEIIAYRVVKT